MDHLEKLNRAVQSSSKSVASMVTAIMQGRRHGSKTEEARGSLRRRLYEASRR